MLYCIHASSTSYVDVVVSVPSKELPCTLCSTVCSMTVKDTYRRTRDEQAGKRGVGEVAGMTRRYGKPTIMTCQLEVFLAIAYI